MQIQTYDQAREYLARVVPWEPGTFTNIHWPFKIPDKKDFVTFPGIACTSLDEAVRLVQWAATTGEPKDVYVCMGAQARCEVRPLPNGRTRNRAIRSQSNTAFIKSLFMDMDIKPEKEDCYASLSDGVSNLGRFLAATGLPKPSMYVLSGGGLHIYWVLDRALTRDEWEPLAHSLLNAAKQHNLKIDEKVTTDAARLLRVPDTFNCKLPKLRPVKLAGTRTDFDYSVDRIANALAPYKVALPARVSVLDQTLFPPKAPLPSSELSAGVTRNDQMTQADMRACLDVIPNTKVDWNFWNTMGMRLWAACDGVDYGLKEWQRWSATNVANGQGDNCSTRWDTFHVSPPDRTGAGAIVNAAREATGDPNFRPTRPTTSANVLGATAANPVVVTGTNIVPVAQGITQAGASASSQTTGHVSQVDLPPTYTRRFDGVIEKTITATDGTQKEVPISNYPITNPWLQEDPNVLHFKITKRGIMKQISLEQKLVNTDEMRRVLQDQGMSLPRGPLVGLGDFMPSWIEHLQQLKASITSSPFGWSVERSKGDIEGFVYGNQLWTPTGTRASANSDPEIARQYSQAGVIDPWVTACKMVTDQGRAELAAIVAAAFGAPLVRFAGEPGVLMSAYSSESGIGKSTALKVAQAVWGDPVRAVQSLSDTQASVMHKIGQIKNLPLYWDELKTEDDTRKFVNITFQVTQGKDKSRLKQNITQREPGTWQTLLVSASNDSLLDYVMQQTNTTTAGLYRVFEYIVYPPDPATQIDPSDASLMVAKLNDHYGNVGLKYAEWLGVNHTTIAKEVGDFRKALGKEVNTTPNERFWIVLISVVCLGARYANQLGVATFDEVALKTFMIQGLEKMRGEIKTQPVDMSNSLNVVTVLGGFLNAMRQKHTLVTNRMHVGRGKPIRNSVKVLNAVDRLDGLYVHISKDDKRLRVSSARLGDWLKDVNKSRHVFMEALVGKLGATKVNGRLGAGTDHAQMTEYLYELDLAGTAYTNFIDEA